MKLGILCVLLAASVSLPATIRCEVVSRTRVICANGDLPGTFLAFDIPSKAAWAQSEGLDTTVVDTTRSEK